MFLHISKKGASKFKLSEGFQHVPVVHLHGEADPVVRFNLIGFFLVKCVSY